MIFITLFDFHFTPLIIIIIDILKKNDKLTKIGYFSILKVILIFFPDTNYFEREKWFTLTNIYSIDTLKWSLN